MRLLMPPPGSRPSTQVLEHRTGYEWLSRDAAEVDAYVADPWCGWDVPPDVIPHSSPPRRGWPTRTTRAHPQRPAHPHRIRRRRPAGRRRGVVEQLGQRYRDAGVADVTVKLYPAARHEILNETNRDEVTGDVVGWLRERIEMA